jgi:hypothetical protein
VDNVIPPTESTWLGAHLAGNAGSHVLLSPLVVHVEVEGHNWRDMLKLAWFATRWLRS